MPELSANKLLKNLTHQYDSIINNRLLVEEAKVKKLNFISELINWFIMLLKSRLKANFEYIFLHLEHCQKELNKESSIIKDNGLIYNLDSSNTFQQEEIRSLPFNRQSNCYDSPFPIFSSNIVTENLITDDEASNVMGVEK